MFLLYFDWLCFLLYVIIFIILFFFSFVMWLLWLKEREYLSLDICSVFVVRVSVIIVFGVIVFLYFGWYIYFKLCLLSVEILFLLLIKYFKVVVFGFIVSNVFFIEGFFLILLIKKKREKIKCMIFEFC